MKKIICLGHIGTLVIFVTTISFLHCSEDSDLSHPFVQIHDHDLEFITNKAGTKLTIKEKDNAGKEKIIYETKWYENLLEYQQSPNGSYLAIKSYNWITKRWKVVSIQRNNDNKKQEITYDHEIIIKITDKMVHTIAKNNEEV